MGIPGKDVKVETTKVESHNGGGTGMAVGAMVTNGAGIAEPKKKKKASKGLKNVQKAHRNVARAMDHLASAVSDGMSTYRTEHRKSEEKKKDGGLRDAIKNSGKAMSDTLKSLSKVPKDLTKSVDSKRTRKQVRNAARFLSGPLGR